MKDRTTAEMAAMFHDGGSATATAAVIATNHCIKRNYCLWHDGVQEVIKVFPEEEPSGVDVGSHLHSKEELKVASPLLGEHSEHFAAPHSRPRCGQTLMHRGLRLNNRNIISNDGPAGNGCYLYRPFPISKNVENPNCWPWSPRLQQKAGTLKGNSAVKTLGIFITSM